jgi:hypothetical protein
LQKLDYTKEVITAIREWKRDPRQINIEQYNTYKDLILSKINNKKKPFTNQIEKILVIRNSQMNSEEEFILSLRLDDLNLNFIEDAFTSEEYTCLQYISNLERNKISKISTLCEIKGKRPLRLKELYYSKKKEGILKILKNSLITVYYCVITEIAEKESEFQGAITKFYILSLIDVKIGPKLRKAGDLLEENFSEIKDLKVRISERVFENSNLLISDKIKFNGRLTEDLVYDEFKLIENRGYIVKNIKKIDKIQEDHKEYYEFIKKESELIEKSNRTEARYKDKLSDLIEYIEPKVKNKEIKRETSSIGNEINWEKPKKICRNCGNEISDRFQVICEFCGIELKKKDK